MTLVEDGERLCSSLKNRLSIDRHDIEVSYPDELESSDAIDLHITLPWEYQNKHVRVSAIIEDFRQTGLRVSVTYDRMRSRKNTPVTNASTPQAAHWFTTTTTPTATA